MSSHDGKRQADILPLTLLLWAHFSHYKGKPSSALPSLLTCLCSSSPWALERLHAQVWPRFSPDSLPFRASCTWSYAIPSPLPPPLCGESSQDRFPAYSDGENSSCMVCVWAMGSRWEIRNKKPTRTT